MKGDILSQTDWLVLPLITVVMFTVIFSAVLVWIMRPGARAAYAARSRMIFDDVSGNSMLDDGETGSRKGGAS